MDRLSRATLNLAKRASAEGAIVVFEPSGRGTDKLFAEALRLTHIVKYSDQRLADVDTAIESSSASLVEVQTLGERGLRYRHRLRRNWSDWLHLSAIAAPRLKDACGAGDWCTAGLIATIASHGQEGLRKLGARELREGLRYGQALAAWNCGFEGARGGMYAVSREGFEQQVAGLLSGRLKSLPEALVEAVPGVTINCPACPPPSRHRYTRQANRARRRKAAA